MKLFKRQKYIEEPDSNYEYWKDPRLGTDDDEGAYDYYACDKPDNKQYKCWSTRKCDDCGKEPRFKRYGKAWEAYWYCWDGWDGDSGFVCWKCLLKTKIYSSKLNFKKQFKQHKQYRKFIGHFKKNNIPITKELKETVMQVCRQGGSYES